MNLGSMKDPSGNNSANGGQTTASIPSLKRTLSGGATSSVIGGASVVGGLSSHLAAGVNTIPSVLHANPNTNPPQMLRAVTSSGVFNRPASASTTNLRGGHNALSMGSNNPSHAVATTTSRSVSQSTMQDWRMYLTIEERQAVRSKIRDAYTSRCTTYEDLLQVACAIEEELLHISAPSRLDYFKSGFEFENRVKLKKDQLQGQLAALDNKRRSNPNTQGSSNSSSSSGGNGGSSSSVVGPTGGSAEQSYKKQRS